jgi:hypothetical protein
VERLGWLGIFLVKKRKYYSFSILILVQTTSNQSFKRKKKDFNIYLNKY